MDMEDIDYADIFDNKFYIKFNKFLLIFIYIYLKMYYNLLYNYKGVKMSYFDGIKVGDKVYSVEFGYGEVTNIDKFRGVIYVFFNSLFKEKNISNTEKYDFDGKRFIKVDLLKKANNQTLFWDEIKFEISEKPKIKLRENGYIIFIQDNNVVTTTSNDKRYTKSGLSRSDRETAEEALKAIKKFTKLLALRDQECENSRGYEFIKGKENYFIYFDYSKHKKWFVDVFYHTFYPDKVYFKTEKDAQKICDILNSDKFELEGE